jgi:CRISPR-associated endonuclease/helicase Cas3
VKAGKEAVEHVTVLLPPEVGGLTSEGMLGHGDPPERHDVADEWRDEQGSQRRKRVRSNSPWEEPPEGMRPLLRIDLRADAEEDEEGDLPDGPRFWHWYEAVAESGSWYSRKEQTLQAHQDKAGRIARRIGEALGLPADLRDAVELAARHHDDGKKRQVWQNSIGNREYPAKALAKSGHNRPPEELSGYRHEFGSLLDVKDDGQFQQQPPDLQDLILHLIAAHHGRARPHFPADEAFDPERSESAWYEAAVEAPRRFARLQRRYGRWGLAWLESLVRAADYLASEDDP